MASPAQPERAILAVNVRGNSLREIEIGMIIVQSVRRFTLQVSLQGSQLDGRSVENRPRHGNKSKPEWEEMSGPILLSDNFCSFRGDKGKK